MRAHRWASLALAALLFILPGCNLIDGSIRRLDELSYEEEELEPTLEPTAGNTPEPYDPNAEYEYELAPADDPDFGFYAQPNRQTKLPIAPETLQEALKAGGIESLPTSDGVRVRTHVQDDACYAIEAIGPRGAHATVFLALRQVAGALGVEAEDIDTALAALDAELIQLPCNAMAPIGSYFVRLADLEDELHMMIFA